MPVNIKAEIIRKEKIKDDIFRIVIDAKEIAKVAKPGQFLEVKVLDGVEPLLRRPISIYNVNEELGQVEFIFQVKGKGTKILQNKKTGDMLDIIGPLGNGTFDVKEYDNVAIIGGGIGMFPLHELSKRLKGSSDVKIYMGCRNKDFVILENEFEEVCNKLVIATDDGSYKEKGFAIDLLKEDIKKEKPDVIFACGPLPMLKAVRQLSIMENIPCQISLEEKMACGIGACLGCAVKLVNIEEVKYKHVCKDGPVFWANEVEI